jgi:SAM-dependent methyltransferase
MSIFSLNADKKLNSLQLFLWFFFNAIRNIRHRNLDDSLIIKKPNFLKIVEFIDLSSNRSPCRRVSDMFWKSLPIDSIFNVLGKIRVFEVGCGNGNYGVFLSEIFGNSFEHYTGVDICKSQEWESFDKTRFTFLEGNANNFLPHINNSNLIITQSALEHFPNDDLYFDQVLEFTKSCNNPIIQIHLMPSSACLRLYLWHGFRQYTPYLISKISKKFGSNEKKILYSLGGKNVNSLHFKYWTKKGINKIGEVQKYNEEFKNSFLNDCNTKLSVKDTSFYCLVILHNVNDDFFDNFIKEV